MTDKEKKEWFDAGYKAALESARLAARDLCRTLDSWVVPPLAWELHEEEKRNLAIATDSAINQNLKEPVTNSLEKYREEFFKKLHSLTPWTQRVFFQLDTHSFHTVDYCAECLLAEEAANGDTGLAMEHLDNFIKNGYSHG